MSNMVVINGVRYSKSQAKALGLLDDEKQEAQVKRQAKPVHDKARRTTGAKETGNGRDAASES